MAPLPRATLKNCLPKNGMAWLPVSYVMGQQVRDRTVCRALEAMGVPIKKREVQIALRSIFDTAVELIPTVMAMERVDRPMEVQFLAMVAACHPLRQHLIGRYFVELCSVLLAGRDRYLANRPGENLANHAPLARAIDEFRAAAEAFFFLEDLALQIDCGVLETTVGVMVRDPGQMATATTAATTTAAAHTGEPVAAAANPDNGEGAAADEDDESSNSDEFAGVPPSSDEEDEADEDVEVLRAEFDAMEIDGEEEEEGVEGEERMDLD